MTKQSSIKYISGLLDKPGGISDSDQNSIAMFRQSFPYFVPVRYMDALATHRKNPFSPAMLSAVRPFMGDWLMFCDFLLAADSKGQPRGRDVEEIVADIAPRAPEQKIELQPVKSNPEVVKDIIAEEVPVTAPAEFEAELPQPEVADEPVKDEQVSVPAPEVNDPFAELMGNEEAAAIGEQPADTLPSVDESPDGKTDDIGAVNETKEANQEKAQSHWITEDDEKEVEASAPVQAATTNAAAVVTDQADIKKEAPVAADNGQADFPELANGDEIVVIAQEDLAMDEEPADIASTETIPVIEETTPTIETVPDTETVPGAKEEQPLIYPVYTEDYFLQQGVKVSPEIPQGIDKFRRTTINDDDRSLMVMMSFTEWLMHFKSNSERQKEETKDQKALRSMWQKEKLAAAMEEENEEIPENVFEMAVNSIQMEDGLASESLAEIYIKQEKYDKAIHMYKKLSLRNPQKNAYFARKIEEILKERQS